MCFGDESKIGSGFDDHFHQMESLNLHTFVGFSSFLSPFPPFLFLSSPLLPLLAANEPKNDSTDSIEELPVYG